MGPTDLYNKAREIGLQFSEGYDQSAIPALTFQSRLPGSPPTFLSYSLAGVRRSAVSSKELLMRGLLGATTARFCIPQASLDNAVSVGQVSSGQPSQAPTPKPGDIIVDQSGTQWIVNDGGVNTVIYNGQTIEHSCLTLQQVV